MQRLKIAIAVSTLTLFAVHTLLADSPEVTKPLCVGIIGCDTSHVIVFTKTINGAPVDDEIAQIKVVAAFPGGSDDLPDSYNRVDDFTAQLAKSGVKIVDSIDELLPLVDAVLLESVDGRKHLEQVRPVFAAGKPVFIDKPVAGTLADAIEIFRLAEEHKVPCFTSSSLRYSPSITSLGENRKLENIVGCDVHAPCTIEPHHPDLFWYGVHGTEMLFTVMGPGCESVSRTHTDGTDVVVGVWKDGRIGTFRGIRDGARGYGVSVYGDKGIVRQEVRNDYPPLVRNIARFFTTGKPPVTAAETLEIFAFMEAADESKRQNGAPVKLSEVLKR